jgi:hypothetical protein
LNALKKEETEPVTKYVARAKAIRNDLLAIGHEIKEDEVVCSVLAGLPTDYETVVSILETHDGELQLHSTLAKLLQVEQRLQRKEDQGEDRAAFWPTSTGRDWKLPERSTRRSCGAIAAAKLATSRLIATSEYAMRRPRKVEAQRLGKGGRRRTGDFNLGVGLRRNAPHDFKQEAATQLPTDH